MNSGLSARFSALFLAGATAVCAQGTAVVEGDRVNVRGAAGLSAEVVTQLRKGETVTVLEPVTLKSPSKGEPTNWFKILLPENTPVWIHSGFLSSSNTVAVNRLNVRGGPGENYSVLSRLVRGDAVRPIREVDDWMEIHPPTNAVAYVAASLLSMPKPDAALAAAEAAPATVAIPEPTPKPVVPVPEPEPEPVEIAQETPVIPAETATPVLIEPVAVPPPIFQSQPVEIVPAEKRRRIVVREGILRRDLHINTPGYFRLEDRYQRRLINYLFVSNPELDLAPFAGSLVVVRGEEFLDDRWPRTPVIEVEHVALP